jgi:extradiol dioxygenase family protein
MFERFSGMKTFGAGIKRNEEVSLRQYSFLFIFVEQWFIIATQVHTVDSSFNISLRYAGEVFENFCFVVVLSGFYIFE